MTIKMSLLKTFVFLMVVVLLLLTGCGVAQSEYDAVVAERDAAKSQLDTAESQFDAAQSQIATLLTEMGAIQIEKLEGKLAMTIPDIAEKIKDGEIAVGTENSLAVGQRYHNIHNVVLGLGCATCHISEMTTQQEVFSAQDVATASAPVDRSGCVACHSVGGPATAFYGSAS